MAPKTKDNYTIGKRPNRGMTTRAGIRLNKSYTQHMGKRKVKK